MSLTIYSWKRLTFYDKIGEALHALQAILRNQISYLTNQVSLVLRSVKMLRPALQSVII